MNMEPKPLSSIQTQHFIHKIRNSRTADEAFETICEISDGYGFAHCLVFEANVNFIAGTRRSGRFVTAISLIMNNHGTAINKIVNDFYANADPYSEPGGREFYNPPYKPFATGSNWYREQNIELSVSEQAHNDKIEKMFGPRGSIGFPVKSAQTDYSPAVCVVMNHNYSADWLSNFLERVAPSVQPLIVAFEEKLYPFLVEQERKRVNLTRREIECLSKLATGYAAKSIAYELQITDAMVTRHLRKAKAKLRVSNTAAAVLKAQKLKLIVF